MLRFGLHGRNWGLWPAETQTSRGVSCASYAKFLSKKEEPEKPKDKGDRTFEF